MSIIGLKTKNGVDYSSLSNKLDSSSFSSFVQNNTLQLNRKLDSSSFSSFKQDNSLVLNSKLDRSSFSNFTQSNTLELLSKLDSSSFSSFTESNTLALSNKVSIVDFSSYASYSSSTLNIQQAILNIEIPKDDEDLNLNVEIVLSRNPNFTQAITLTNELNYDLMKISLDSQFVQLTEQEHSIGLSYYTGNLVVTLTNAITGFDPTVPWYAKAYWSNGTTSVITQQIVFQYCGHLHIPFEISNN